jgi:hypothetical protein
MIVRTAKLSFKRSYALYEVRWPISTYYTSIAFSKQLICYVSYTINRERKSSRTKVTDMLNYRCLLLLRELP